MINQESQIRLPDHFPYSCQWEITCRCNLRCLMCYTDCFNQPDHIRQELPTAEMLRILDELAEAGCLELCLTGGEPLARPDFFDIYQHAARKGFLITLFTNGTLLTEAGADRLAEYPPLRIEISIHGRSSDLFERITQQNGSFQRCLTGIRLLLDRGLRVTLKTTAMTINQHEVLAIKKFAADLGPVAYKLGEELRASLDGSDEPKGFQLSARELDALNRRDPDLREEACKTSSQTPGPCRSGLRSFHIDAYGMLQLCSGNRRQSFDLRRGSFREGFFERLPAFACPWKAPTVELLHPAVNHA